MAIKSKLNTYPYTNIKIYQYSDYQTFHLYFSMVLSVLLVGFDNRILLEYGTCTGCTQTYLSIPFTDLTA